MAKISFGKTKEDLEAQEALKERQRENDIKEHINEQERKLLALRNKQKMQKYIIYAVGVIILVALLVFGTYNTFFKHYLDINDVNQQIFNKVNSYPADGLDNYIRTVCEPMFLQKVEYDRSKYDWIDVDESTIYISRVRKLSNNLAEVYFSADVLMKPADVRVTDEAVIERLRRNGFANVANPTPVPTETAIPTETSEDDEINSEVKGAEPVSKDKKKKKKKKTTKKATPTPTEETTVETTPAPTPVPTEVPIDPNAVSGKISSKDSVNDEEEVEYYIVGNGQIYQKSKAIRVRYNFYLPVEFFNVLDADGKTAVASGYKPASNLNFYLLNDVHQEKDFDKLELNPNYAFTDIKEVDEETLAAAQIKVDNILNALYAGRDTSQDFYNYRTFNTFGATYGKLLEFHMYESTNRLGYNATAQYTVTTPQGFEYQVNCYLLVEPVGSGQSRTWKITKIT